MKKLLLLSLTILLFSCGGNDSVYEEPEPSGPSKISLTVKEKWGARLSGNAISHNYQNSDIDICANDNREYLKPLYPFKLEVGQDYTSINHYSLDSLKLTLPNSQYIFGFNLGPNEGGVQVPTTPKYIKHIELVNFDSNDKILIDKPFLWNYYSFNHPLTNTIVYFSSNVSEGFLNSIVYDAGPPGARCPDLQEAIFVKSEVEFNDFAVKEIQIPYNEESNSIEVGDIVMGSDLYQFIPCGNCIDIVNGAYTILGKEYID